MTLLVADVLITVRKIKRPPGNHIESLLSMGFVITILGFVLLYCLQSTTFFATVKKIQPDNNELLTTPMPIDVQMECELKSENAFIIEKYDAQKVHAKIMANKIRRMAEKLPKDNFERINKEIYLNDHHHMMYVNRYNKMLDDTKTVHSANDNQKTDEIVFMQNIEAARNMGCGVIVLEYPFYAITEHQESSRSVLKRLFDLVPKYGLKLSIILRNYYKRNVVSFKKEIHHFLKTYGRHPGLYKYKKDNSSIELPIIYILGSFNIQHDKWYNLLSPNSKSSIRDTENDAIFLGQVRDEEDNLHIKKSKFDGFFTCCHSNGEYFGNTWKNWDSLSSWADSHELLWSTGVVEGSEGILSLKAALNTVLRFREKPTFVLFNNINYRNEVITVVQNWNDITSNLNDTNQRFL